MFRRTSTLTATVVTSMVILPRRPVLDVVVVDEHLKWNDGRRSASTKEDVDSPLASDASGRVCTTSTGKQTHTRHMPAFKQSVWHGTIVWSRRTSVQKEGSNWVRPRFCASVAVKQTHTRHTPAFNPSVRHKIVVWSCRTPVQKKGLDSARPWPSSLSPIGALWPESWSFENADRKCLFVICLHLALLILHSIALV